MRDGNLNKICKRNMEWMPASQLNNQTAMQPSQANSI